MAPPTWSVGQVLTAADVNNWFVPLAAVKVADQSVTSNTTLVADTELFVPLAASVSYVFHCFLDYEGAATGTGDIKWNFAVPAGATVRYTYANFSPGGASTSGNLVSGTTVASAGTNGAGNLKGVLMFGTVIVAGTSGNMQLQWAQNTSSGTSTIMHAQSCLMLQRAT